MEVEITSRIIENTIETEIKKITKSVLVNGENCFCWALQVRTFALFNRRELVLCTSGRIIKIKRGLLGGYKLADFR